MFDYLFFDLDGTLTDPAEGITNSWIYALKYFGVEIPDYKTLCSYIGPPLATTFRNDFHFEEEKISEGITKFREYFGEKGLFENKPYDGIIDLLDSAKKSGKHLCTATSKPVHFAKRILDKFELSPYFDHICGGGVDENRCTKAEVIENAIETCGITDKSKILMIGDRFHDIEGAKKTGIKSCGVLYGFGKRDEMIEYKADYIVETVSDLKKLILSI